PLGETRLTLLPDGRQLRFGGAMVLVGLVAVVLHLLLRQGVAAALADLEVAALERFDTPAGRALFALVATPLLPWVVAGLAVAPLALRLLRLPALAGGARPGTAPTPGLFAFLIGAVIAAELVRRAIIGPLARLPVIGDTTAPEYVAWYVSTLVLLTLVTARVGALLMRRHRAAAIGMAGT